MKKVLALLLVLLMAASIVACGSNGSGNSGKDTEPVETEPAGGNDEGAGDASDDTNEETEPEGGQASDDGTLIMATEAGFMPYEYTEDGETVVGVDVDIANEIAKAMGKELVIKNMDFDGALLAVQQGQVDFAAAGISITEERAEVMDFTIEYATSDQVIVIKKGTDAVTSGDDLTNEGVIVGVQMGNTAQYYCEDDLEIQPNTYSKFLEAALDLKNGKIDCIVMDSLPAAELVAANDDLEILDEILFTESYALAVQKGNTEMLNAINEVLEQLVADGKIEEFTLKHTQTAE